MSCSLDLKKSNQFLRLLTFHASLERETTLSVHIFSHTCATFVSDNIRLFLRHYLYQIDCNQFFPCTFDVESRLLIIFLQSLQGHYFNPPSLQIFDGHLLAKNISFYFPRLSLQSSIFMCCHTRDSHVRPGVAQDESIHYI